MKLPTILKIVFCFVFALLAQAEEHSEAVELSRQPLTEFTASNQFQSLTIAQPIFRGFNVESRFYRILDLHEDALVIGGSYNFRLLSNRIILVPGFNIFAGRDERTSPAVSLRGKGIPFGNPKGTHLVVEGSMFQALLPTEAAEHNTHSTEELEPRHDTHVDVTHISVVTRRGALGVPVEYVQYRKEHELKLGGRFQYNLPWKHWSLLALPLWPIGHGRFEFRAGILFDPFAH